MIFNVPGLDICIYAVFAHPSMKLQRTRIQEFCHVEGYCFIFTGRKLPICGYANCRLQVKVAKPLSVLVYTCSVPISTKSYCTSGWNLELFGGRLQLL